MDDLHDVPEDLMNRISRPDAVPVPAFDELVARARQTRKTRLLRLSLLQWAAVLSLIFLPAVWMHQVPAPVIEQDTVTDIYDWNAPSDDWFFETGDDVSATASTYSYGSEGFPSDLILNLNTQNLDSL